MASVQMPCNEKIAPTKMANHIPKCTKCMMWWAASPHLRGQLKELS